MVVRQEVLLEEVRIGVRIEVRNEAMKECATCKHYRYFYKGTHPNYAGCEKASFGLDIKCTNYKKVTNMKDFWKSWKFWAAVVAVILLIVAVVLYFNYPVFGYAVSGLLIGLAGGFIWGYYIGQKKRQ